MNDVEINKNRYMGVLPMKYITLLSASRLAGLANMLELLGHDTEDRLIAIGMEAPYLFVRDNTGYKAGARLYQPQWMNLYLHPRGFHIKEQLLSSRDVCAYLRSASPAMLTLNVGKGVMRQVVFSGYCDGKYSFINIKPQSAPCADTFTLTASTLKRRITDEVIICTLEQCKPQQVDLITPLMTSLLNLEAYSADVLKARTERVTREEFDELRENLLRPLMQDMLPLVGLLDDSMLADELRLLNHDYQHIFTYNDVGAVALDERLPKRSIRQCVTWFRENILDRLSELGATNELIDGFMKTNLV